jgi:hypothetical protein
MLRIENRSPPGERRKHTRFKLSLPLAYQRGPEKDTLRTVDLSLGGIRIETDSPIPVDERLDLILLLEYEAIRPVGKIAWSNPSSDRKYDVGICFETISHQCLKRLEQFLSRITLREKLAELEKDFGHSGSKDLEGESLQSDRLRFNFLNWLYRSYPWDYERYADWPEIGENVIRDFLKGKGFDEANSSYLLESLADG